MIDENNGCITKSKLTIIVKTLSNIMTGAGQQPSKQINILRDTETDKHLGRKHTTGRKMHTYK